MKVYFDKESLVQSQELYEDVDWPYSLFCSASSIYPFVKYEEELAEINDYCVFVLCRLEDKLKTLIDDSEVSFELIKGCRGEEKRTAKEMNDLFDPAYMFSPVFTWERLSRDINKCTLLLLVLSYLESSLNEIAKWFCEERSLSMGRKEKGSNEITFYLRKIGQCCQCDLEKALGNELAYIDKVRKIRNQFVHRGWSVEEKSYNEFRLCDVFDAASKFFAGIERAACGAGIITFDTAWN